MPLLTWLRSSHHRVLVDKLPSLGSFEDQPKVKPKANIQPEQANVPDEPIDYATEEFTFSELAEQLDLYCEKARFEAQKHQDTIENLTKSEAEKARLEQVIQQLQSENESLHTRINQQSTELNRMQQSNTATRKNYKSEIATLNSQLQQLNSRNAGLVNQYNLLQVNAAGLGQKVHDLQFDLELLRCKQDGQKLHGKKAAMQLPPQSFVVVLIDGDAYGWAHDVFSNASIKSPGALAAIRLKNEVTKYILDHNVPPSKVIARVYVNDTGMQTHNSKQTSFKKHQKQLLASFRVQFTEAIPLFDFVDVGHGKERADEKIRENFDLLLSNPYCQRIFLATCTDNGFARMLEPYQYHTEAYNKIILVSPGYVEREIARLNFREVVWPAVFAKREAANLPPKERVKRLAAEKAKMDVMVHNQKIGFVGVVDLRIAGLVRDCVKVSWDVKKVGRGEVGRLGLRMLAAPGVEVKGAEMGVWEGGVD